MIYKLINKKQKCTHGKFNHIIDDLNVNCDLGVYVYIDGVQEFQVQYSSAVIKKSNLIDYTDEPIL